MRKILEFSRVCVVSTAKGDRTIKVRYPLTKELAIPVQDKSGRFGQVVYRWDGKEATVSGFPVYR